MNKMYTRISKKLKYLGLNMNPKVFVYMRLCGTAILFVGLLFLVDYGYIVAPLVSILYYVMLEYLILDQGIKNRCIDLENDALDFFPIFLLSLSSERNVKRAIYLSTEIVSNDLSLEFKRVLKDVSIGKSLEESLTLLKSRIPSDIIVNIIISIIETNRVGNNLNDSVNVQLGYIRERQRKDIFYKYKLIPFKIALLSIIFVFLMLLLLIIFNMYL